MNTVTKTVHLYARTKRYADGIEYWVSEFSELALEDFGRRVSAAEVTFELSADLNPVKMAIEELEAQKAKAADEFRATVARINERLSKLQAITNEVADHE